MVKGPALTCAFCESQQCLCTSAASAAVVHRWGSCGIQSGFSNIHKTMYQYAPPTWGIPGPTQQKPELWLQRLTIPTSSFCSFTWFLWGTLSSVGHSLVTWSVAFYLENRNFQALCSVLWCGCCPLTGPACCQRGWLRSSSEQKQHFFLAIELYLLMWHYQWETTSI